MTGMLTEDDAVFTEMRQALDVRTNQLASVLNEYELLEESYTSMALNLDDRGWQPLTGLGNPLAGPSLRELNNISRTLRVMFAGNPLVKRGLNVRYNYIWSDGLNFGNEGDNPRVKPNGVTESTDNARLVFSQSAYEEAEHQLGTDGNVFLLAAREGKRVIRVPMSQITEFISNPDTGLIDDIRYYKRIWVKTIIDSTGNVATTHMEAWYPACSYTGPLPATIQNVVVVRDAAIEKVSANKQGGWILGLPDLLAVHYWARAYKEFLESNWTLTRALAKYAWKVTATTPGGQARASAKMQAAIQAVPMPGSELPTTGQTAVTMAGLDISAVSKAGANVDFEAGRPLASMIAAGLEISTETLLADTKSGGEMDLEESTVDMVTSRQALWSTAFVNVLTYLGVTKPVVKFPPIQGTPLWRLIQGIVTAASTGVLFPLEVRQMLLTGLRDLQIDEKTGVPPAGMWQKYISPPNSPTANPGTTPQKTPDATGTGGAGSKSPAGPQSDGTNQARKDTTKK